jgi:hypothetical protein
MNAADEHLINCSYDLAPFRKAGIDSGTLKEIVMQESNGLWVDVDGSGGRVMIVGDVMTIRQAFRVHRELLSMLNAILNAEKRTYGVYHAEHVACLQALQKPVTVNFSDLPLNDAMEFVSMRTGSRIYIDHVGIEESGLLVDEPINFVMVDRSAETTLRMML